MQKWAKGVLTLAVLAAVALGFLFGLFIGRRPRFAVEEVASRLKMAYERGAQGKYFAEAQPKD